MYQCHVYHLFFPQVDYERYAETDFIRKMTDAKHDIQYVYIYLTETFCDCEKYEQ